MQLAFEGLATLRTRETEVFDNAFRRLGAPQLVWLETQLTKEIKGRASSEEVSQLCAITIATAILRFVAHRYMGKHAVRGAKEETGEEVLKLHHLPSSTRQSLAEKYGVRTAQGTVTAVQNQPPGGRHSSVFGSWQEETPESSGRCWMTTQYSLMCQSSVKVAVMSFQMSPIPKRRMRKWA